MTRSQEPGFDALRELEDALCVTPSPDFAARVRERVAAAPQVSGSTWWARRLALAGAVPAAVVVVVLWSSRGEVVSLRVPEPAPEVVVALSPARPAASPARPAATETRPRAPAPAIAPARPARRTPTAARRAVPAAASDAPFVMISGEDARALDRLLVVLQTSRSPLPEFGGRVDAETGELLPPAPIELPALDPSPLPVIRRDERHAVILNGRTPR
jgi:hypothetical protein